MLTYQNAKRLVLVMLLSSVCFLFGYLFVGSKFGATATPMGQEPQGGPPAPVMQAITALKDRIKANPGDSSAYVDLADLYFQAGKYDQASHLYENGIKLNTNDVVARNNLALCYHLLNKDSEAFGELSEALKIAPNSQHLWLTLGVVNYKTGQRKKAMEALERAYKLDPKSEAGGKAKEILSSLSRS